MKLLNKLLIVICVVTILATATWLKVTEEVGWGFVAVWVLIFGGLLTSFVWAYPSGKN